MAANPSQLSGELTGAARTSPPSVLGDTGPLVVDRSTCPRPSTLWQGVRKSLFARSPLLKSVAFRIGFTFWLLFNVCLGFAGWGAYETLQQRVLSRIDDALLERYALIGAAFEGGGIERVLELSRGPELLPMRSSLGFFLADPEGERIGGNVPVAPMHEGWSVVRGFELGTESGHDQYRFLTVPLGDYTLSLGKSLGPLTEMRDVAGHCLLLMFAVSTTLALMFAAFIAQRLRRRTEGWSGALERLAGGNLAMRLPISPAQDSIDDMALTVNAALERLARNVDAMRGVSTAIAHDLKTPLNRLYIHLEEAVADIGALDTSRLERSLDEAIEEARHINQTFEALLRVSQIESGARRKRFEHFDLTEVLRTVGEIYEPVVEESCTALRLGFDPTGSLPMYGDRELVMQLVVNLVENAVHHCGRTGDHPEAGVIEIAGGRRDGHVWLSVNDRGPGVPEAEREKVLQRLYRMENSRSTRGTGLGLSLVKAVADLHCGRVVLSDNAPGLRFEVSFDRDCPREKAAAMQ